MQTHMIADAVARAIQKQPWYARYKGTLIMVCTVLAWLAGVLLAHLTMMPDWAGVAIGLVGGVAGILLNRFTQDGFTPSMAPRLEQAAHTLSYRPGRHAASGGVVDQARHNLGG